MIKDKVRAALNEQIKFEFESAYLYLAMAAFFQEKNLDGMAQWMRVQSMEEMTHAMKFYNHIIEREGHVELLPLGIKKTEWSTPEEAFQDAFQHEQFISSRINGLLKLAREENDYSAEPLLQWFVNEQIEEEASTSRVAALLKQVGSDSSALFMLDRDLGTRTFTMPTEEQSA